MSATDDSGNARRGLTGWLGRLRGPLAGGEAAAGGAMGSEAVTDSTLLDAVVSGLPGTPARLPARTPGGPDASLRVRPPASALRPPLSRTGSTWTQGL